MRAKTGSDKCWLSFDRLCDDRCVAFSKEPKKPCALLNTLGDAATSLRTIARNFEGPMSGTQFPPGGPR